MILRIRIEWHRKRILIELNSARISSTASISLKAFMIAVGIGVVMWNVVASYGNVDEAGACRRCFVLVLSFGCVLLCCSH